MTACAILQSSYLPWRGYFDLIRRADVFVFLDQVQYTRQDWRNRNLIKTANGLLWLTVPVHDDQRMTLKISDVRIDQSKKWVQKHLRSIEQAYARAPFQTKIVEHLAKILDNPPEFLFEMNRRLIQCLWNLLSGAEVKRFVGDETIHLDPELNRNDRLIEICRRLHADHYISGPSAKNYLDVITWKKAGIQVEFVNYDYKPYPQLHGAFEPKVSIVDTLMNLGPGCLQEALDQIKG